MVLYHASPAKDLTVIEPQRTLSHDKYIGDFVFATADKKLALMYLVPKGIPTLMDPSDKSPNITIGADQKEFMKRDRGGAVYTLPVDSFVKSPQRDIGQYERVSRVAVQPLSKMVFDSVLGALLSVSIQVHFVDDKTMQHLVHNPTKKN